MFQTGFNLGCGGRGTGGRLVGLIHRINAQAPGHPDKTLSTLLVIRVDGQRLCAVGAARTNEDARALADRPGTCP